MTFAVLVPLSMVLPLIIMLAVIEALGAYLFTIIGSFLVGIVVLFLILCFGEPSFGNFILIAAGCLIGAPILGCCLQNYYVQRDEERQRQREWEKQQGAEQVKLHKLQKQLADLATYY